MIIFHNSTGPASVLFHALTLGLRFLKKSFYHSSDPASAWQGGMGTDGRTSASLAVNYPTTNTESILIGTVFDFSIVCVRNFASQKIGSGNRHREQRNRFFKKCRFRPLERLLCG